MDIAVRSTAFREGEMIPKNYTCDGENISPPLAWTSVPEETKGIALICDDPDAPRGTFVHWVLFNLPPDMRELPEAIPPADELENGARHGVNGSGKAGYRGPCPPGGVHRYYFRLYALDTQLTLPSGVQKSQLVDAMEGHILGRGQLMGRYKR
ncbi:phosphatidylethanolamine-binding protein [candidate division TA06 bacterium DG_26]|uniref:Phosphatidylethanolamine-binding protein n=1 Tax=candidate division TA06 bacterium DG_26 TaxID=1703771 RepID=A0A0S7WJJ4_UNCT6|nr:MAG: phosphatidylethanolamine-binding protein [candidate division TA06 bacterium DG_26]